MIDLSKIDYSAFDRPEILMFLFHPRPEWDTFKKSDHIDIEIPVEKDVFIGGKLHPAGKGQANILFFHGNGEIVSDYNTLGPVYTESGINFIPVDYRGYGRSTGRPTVTGMMRDCHVIFKYIREWLEMNGYSGPMVVMGRSLGSASACELAKHYPGMIDGLIIESGFALSMPLLRLLGINPSSIGLSEEMAFRNPDKIRDYTGPFLVIHAEYDNIIPFSDGKILYEKCGSGDKKLLMIPGADHNTIFSYGLTNYMKAVKEIADKVLQKKV